MRSVRQSNGGPLTTPLAWTSPGTNLDGGCNHRGFNHGHHNIACTPSSQVQLLKPKPARRPAAGIAVPTTNFRSPSRRCGLLAGIDTLRCCAARTSDHDHYAWVRPRCSPVAGPLAELLASQSGSDKHLQSGDMVVKWWRRGECTMGCRKALCDDAVNSPGMVWRGLDWHLIRGDTSAYVYVDAHA